MRNRPRITLTGRTLKALAACADNAGAHTRWPALSTIHKRGRRFEASDGIVLAQVWADGSVDDPNERFYDAKAARAIPAGHEVRVRPADGSLVGKGRHLEASEVSDCAAGIYPDTDSTVLAYGPHEHEYTAYVDLRQLAKLARVLEAAVDDYAVGAAARIRFYGHGKPIRIDALGGRVRAMVMSLTGE